MYTYVQRKILTGRTGTWWPTDKSIWLLGRRSVCFGWNMSLDVVNHHSNDDSDCGKENKEGAVVVKTTSMDGQSMLLVRFTPGLGRPSQPNFRDGRVSE